MASESSKVPEQALNPPVQGSNPPEKALNTPNEASNTPKQPSNPPNEVSNTPKQPSNPPKPASVASDSEQEVETLLFLNLQSTGIPGRKDGEIRITELAIIAVKRHHFLEAGGEEPRVQSKFVMCFDPKTKLNAKSGKLSRLNKTMLKYEPDFDLRAVNLIKFFINMQEQPVCFVAHNGFKFHFQLLQYHLKKLKAEFPEDAMCVDSLYAFFDILDEEGDMENGGYGFYNPLAKVRKVRKRGGPVFKSLWRDRYYQDSHPSASYKLCDIYNRIVEDGPELDESRAESHCLMMLRIASSREQKFMDWVDNYQCPFSDVPKALM